jgi:hypothetical protein
MRYLLTLIFAFNVLFSASFVYPNFKQCYNKNLKSIVYFGNTKAIAIAKHYAVSYSKTKPSYPYAKHDPFLNLYLFYSPKVLHPVHLKDTKYLSLGEWLASMDDNSLYAGNFAKRGIGLSVYFEQNAKTPPNSIVTCLCCDVYGLGVGDKKFISSNLIKRFLNSTEIFYGDIGVRFAKKGKKIVIASINQMRINKNLKVGDVIKKINGKKVKNLQDLENKILFTKRNQSIKLEFFRKNALHVESIKVFQKNGGGEASDSFLEAKGMFFDRNLTITKVIKGSFADKNGLKPGDKLVQIDRKSVKNQNDARIVFSKTKKKLIYLLFGRGGSQFFIKVDK